MGALVVGGTAGALLRYGMTTAWPLPRHVFVSTTVTAAVAFMVAGFLVSVGVTTAVRATVFGFCASAASLSAWAVLTISQPREIAVYADVFARLQRSAVFGEVARGVITDVLATRD